MVTRKWIPGHSAAQDLDEVHKRAIDYYKNKSNINSDKSRAKQMQNYLYTLKNLNNDKITDSQNKSIIQQVSREIGLEQLQSLLNETVNVLNKEGKHKFGNTLFNRSHKFEKTKVGIKGADDIVEEEIYSLFKAMALNTPTKEQLNFGLSGQSRANIGAFVNKTTDEIQRYFETSVKSTLDAIETINGIQESTDTDITEKISIKAKPGKVDLHGYSKDVDITATIKPEYIKMAEVFQGANFTIKNYRSNTNTITIHFGSTNLYKALMGAFDFLQYNIKDSNHLFFHSVRGYNKYQGQEKEDVGLHIYHLRYIYELSGVGLYDEQGNPISAADFLIYNDPVTDKIFVRSTKAMIYENLTKTQGTIGNPYKSVGQLKTYFD